MALQLNVLGRFELRRDDEPIADRDWKTQKNKQLLKILLTEAGRAVSKDRLVEWLWPDLLPEAAARNLRVAVSQLRRLLEPDLAKPAASRVVVTTDGGYAWRSTPDLWWDVERFETACAALEAAQNAPAERLAQAERARAFYGGPYLPEDRYEDWATARREQLQEAYYALLTRMAEWNAQAGRYRRAIALCRELLSDDPCRESVWRQRMLYHYLVGECAEALRAYEACASALRAHLDVGVSRETQALADGVRARRVAGADARYPTPDAAPQLPYTLSPGSVPFVGREAELASLIDHLERASRGRGGVAFVSGEAGVGKTRLAHEALERGFRGGVIEVAGRELEATSSYAPWRRAVQRLVSRLPAHALDALLPVQRAELASLVPSLRDRSPDLPGNPALPPERARLRRHESVLALLARAAAEQPLAVLLDDAHWMDEASLALLAYLAPRVAQRPIQLLITCRSGVRTPSLARALASVPESAHLALSRLSATACAALLRRFPWAEGTGAPLAARLHREAEGNPLFLVSTLQHLFESGTLVAEDGKWRRQAPVEVGVPTTMQQLFSHRLARLDEPALRLARLCAVLGEAEWALLETAWESKEDCLAPLSVLVGAHVLVEAEGRFAFSHGRLAEVVYNETPPALRAVLHARALAALERRYRDQRAAWLPVLVEHAYRAGVWEKALEYAVEALARDECVQLHEQLCLAERGVEAADVLLKSGKDKRFAQAHLFALLKHRVRIVRLLGDREQEARDVERMAQLADALDDPSRGALALQQRAQLHWLTGGFARAREAAQRGAEAFQALGDDRGRAACLELLGRAWGQLGEPKRAEDALHTSLTLCQRVDDPAGQARALVALGHVHFFSLARYAEALDLFERAQALFERAGDRASQARTLGNVGNVLYYHLGRLEDAVRCYREALAIDREIGDKLGQATSLQNIGNVYRTLHLGKHREAFEHLQAAYGLCEEMDDPLGMMLSLDTRARLHLALGGPQAALELQQRALALCRDLGHRDEEAGSLYELSRVQLELDNPEEALRLARASEAISVETGDQRALAYTPLAQGEALCALGEHGQALACFERGLAQAVKLDVTHERIEALTGLASVHLARGEIDRALARSGEAATLMESVADAPDDPAVCFRRFQALDAKGDPAATGLLERAHASLMDTASKLGDDADGFLHGVRLNREIVQTWEQHVQNG